MLFEIIYSWRFDEAIKILNDNQSINFSTFCNCKFHCGRNSTLLNELLWHDFEYIFRKPSNYEQETKLFRLLINKNEFANNIILYQFLKSELPIFLKDRSISKDYPYAFIKFYFEIYKMIKMKLKEEIENQKILNYLNENDSNELNSLPKELRVIISDYFTHAKNISSDLMTSLFSDQTELLFDEIHQFNGFAQFPLSWKTGNQNPEPSNCCTIL